MLKILYWNIKKKGDTLIEDIKKISQEIDILIIAELSPSENKLKIKGSSVNQIISNISDSTGLKYIGNNNKSWLQLWVRENDKINISLIEKYDTHLQPKELSDKDINDSENFTEYLNKFERMLFYKIKFKNLEFILVPIHFPSRMYASIGKQKDISVQFRTFIEKIEKRFNLNSIVVGDFNMNPFEPGMIHHEGFHALPAQNLNKAVDFYGSTFNTYYNPSWVKFGDFEIQNNILKQKPAGSYYIENSNDLNYYWHVFDQVILRKSLIGNFSFESFKYITSINQENDLLNYDLSPNDKEYSDHLPITFSIKN